MGKASSSQLASRRGQGWKSTIHQTNAENRFSAVAVVRMDYCDGGSRKPFVVKSPTLERLGGPFDDMDEAEGAARDWNLEHGVFP